MSKKLPPHAWSASLAYYTIVHDILNIELRLLEPEFVEWYMDLSPDERETWKSDMIEYELEREADQVYKDSLKMAKTQDYPTWTERLAPLGGPDDWVRAEWEILRQDPKKFAEGQREICLKVERFVYESSYSYLIEDLEEALSRPWDHDKYVNRICEKYVNEQIDDTLRLFNLSEKDISRQSALALRRLVGFIDARCRYEDLAKWSVPNQERLDRSAQLMLAHMEDLKRGCTNEELEAINDLYDIYLSRNETAYGKNRPHLPKPKQRVTKKSRTRKARKAAAKAAEEAAAKAAGEKAALIRKGWTPSMVQRWQAHKKECSDTPLSVPPKLTSKKDERLLEKYMPLIKETYETWTSVVNKKADIYKNLARAPGSAFSRK